MTITIKYFAAFRDIIGTNQQEIEIQDTATVADVITDLQRRYPDFDDTMARIALAAVNEQYTERDTALQAHDVLALFPPVSGG